jgi:hypothetical protein
LERFRCDWLSSIRAHRETIAGRMSSVLLVIYSGEMQEKAQRSRVLQFVVCLWIVAAQVWYYLQFKTQFQPIFSAALRKLWH